ncbi:ArsC family reductase [Methylophilus glucosoxydans]|jgi:arsenate reductase (glutaredoxin)|uniref:ArsC family reductase n=1 Tax=Methylophilus glucosoxydans TaxID=752553 RepID=A0ABW3GGB9_9PROT|nr:ArsC family reductase [Methylophilus sp. 13]MBF5039153.1 ArsC family reductase [Methylophilus sp. 13]
MKLYGIPNCNTVKKARDWLDQHAIAYEFHDFKKQGLDSVTGQAWLQQYPWEKLVNRSGMTWRNLAEPEKNSVVDAASALTLMQSKTSVIKRPVLVNADKIIALGFNEADYRQLFAQE